MEVRSFSWRPAEGEGVVRTWLKGANSIEDAQALMELLPDDHDARGNFFLEVVEPGLEDRESLAGLLAPIIEEQAEEVSEYLTMPDPSPAFTTFRVGEDRKIDKAWTTNYRVVAIPSVVVEREAPSVLLVERKARFVVRQEVCIVSWDPPGSFPVLPKRELLFAEPPSGIPGQITGGIEDRMREEGNPDAVVKFELGWASRGPAYLTQVREEGEREGESVGFIAEKFLTWVANQIQQVAEQDLSTALDRWESDLFVSVGDEEVSGRDKIRDLAWFSGMVDLVGNAVVHLGTPTSHDPYFYFAPAPMNHEIDEAKERSENALSELRERLRTDLSVFSALSTTETLRLAQQSQRASDRLQRTVAVLGGVILGPTVIASIFGANVKIPGEGEGWGFLLMLVLMVFSGFLLWSFLDRVGARGKEES
jgi:hypothetical protein